MSAHNPGADGAADYLAYLGGHPEDRVSARDEAAAAKPTVYLRDWKKAAQKEHDDLIELRIKTAEEDEIVALPNFIDGYGAGLRAGWDAGREKAQRRIDAALALLKRFGPKAVVAYDAEVCDLVRDVKLALTTEEQER